MIKKDNLLNQISELESLEKRLIPLLSRQISSSLFFSNLKEKERNSIIEQLQSIAVNKKRHIEILNGIKEEVSKGEKDVY